MSRKKSIAKSALKIIITLGISAACLYFAARKIDIQKILIDLKSLQVGYVALAAAVSATALSIRAFRWHQVVRREKQFPFSTTFWATAIGYLANNILPARAGEVIRSVILGLGSGIRKSLVLATALTERIIDAGVLLLMALVMLQFTDKFPASIRDSWSLLLPVVIIVLLAVFLSPFIEGFLHKIPSVLPANAGIREKLRALISGMLDGVRVFHNIRLLMVFLFASVLIWFIDASVFMLLALSLGSDLTVPQAIIFAAAIGFASSIPSTPGFVGVFQAVAVLLLPIFGIAADRAFLLVSLMQLMGLTITGILGGIGWVVMQRRIGAARLEQELAEAE